MTPKTLKGGENMSANKIKSKIIYIYIPQRRKSSEIENKMQKQR